MLLRHFNVYCTVFVKTENKTLKKLNVDKRTNTVCAG